MGRFGIPEGWTAQAYRFALDPTPAQVDGLLSHAGGARFAYNVMLAAVKANLDQRGAERSYGIAEADLTPALGWSFQALRKEFNRRKHSVAVGDDGTPWWSQNSKEVYAGACRSLAEALSNWQASRTGARRGPLKATVRFERGRWQVSLTCLVQRDIGRPAHVKPSATVVGIDAGVKDLIVVADPTGTELARHRAPRELTTAQRKLRALQRKAARQIGPWDTTTSTKRSPSRGWVRTQREIGRVHARVAQLRADRLHKLSTGLAQTHDVIGVETLAIKNMMAGGGTRKRGLNRAFADAGLGELFRQLDYKTSWYGAQLIKADRWFPSSKLCSGCGVVKAKLHLAERTYVCGDCGLVIDRDLNAAVNLARHAQRETDPSTGVVTGGADHKTTPRGAAGGDETRTRTDVGGDADGGGSASPEGEAA